MHPVVSYPAVDPATLPGSAHLQTHVKHCTGLMRKMTGADNARRLHPSLNKLRLMAKLIDELIKEEVNQIASRLDAGFHDPQETETD